MTGPCFVDADVFVYARDPRDSFAYLRVSFVSLVLNVSMTAVRPQ
jgi:hypothetical protein